MAAGSHISRLRFPLLSLAACAAAILLSTLQWESEYFYRMDHNTTRLPQQDDIIESDYRRTTVHLTSQGERLMGWFYEPLPEDPATPPPAVIMSHGLGAQSDMGLHAYAEQFAQAGMAVLVIDYRCFGGSGGEPRHWVSWRRHVEDVQAALDWVIGGGLGAGRVDTQRIALWGVSYSGGHMLVTAAQRQNWDKVSAVVANEPYLSGSGDGVGKAVKERGLSKVVRLVLAALLDKLSEVGTRLGLHLPPVYVKLVGSFKELAILNMSDEELALSRSGHPSGPPVRIGGWRNLVMARMLLDHLQYKPIKHVPNVRCPVLLVVGAADAITPPEFIREAARILGDKASVLERPYGHIELHRRMTAPEELAPVIDFLRGALGLQPQHVDTHPHEEHPEQDAAEVL